MPTFAMQFGLYEGALISEGTEGKVLVECRLQLRSMV